MGLGKTVQAVCACILRNAISLSQDKPKLPTLIVSPNDAVLMQWHETLLKAGIPSSKIYRFQARRSPNNKKKLSGDFFVLCNRYDLQVELRHVFDNTSKTERLKAISPLWPHTPKALLLVLKNQYLAEKGKAVNEYIERGDGISMAECITDYLSWDRHKVTPIFETVVIDEAHFLKSLKTYWGMAASLLGLHAHYIVPMSGTPFNNNVDDLATLMTFIDPSVASAKARWWKKATDVRVAENVREAISDWSGQFLLRRGKDAIANKLPAKIVTSRQVLAYPIELAGTN